jgi:phage terminase large subunit
MIAFAQKWPSAPDVVVIDPAAEGFILQLKEDSNLRIRAANNAVLKGIQLVSSALDAGALMITPRCKHLIDELMGYSWDPKAQERGEDKPIKQNDHGCDALRYGLMAYEKEITRRVMEIGRQQAAMASDPLAMARL